MISEAGSVRAELSGRSSADVDDMQGLWWRSAIVWPDGTAVRETSVWWLQGRRAFIDLRQQHSALPVGARCLADLSLEDMLSLARQEGFGGYLSKENGFFEWKRVIDFQPVSPYSDVGSLNWRGDVLVEEGRDVKYVEDWHRSAEGPSPCAAVRLDGKDDGRTALVVRVGALFMYARSRGVEIPPGQTLAQALSGASSLKAARERIDCEISFGQIMLGSWRIFYSTLPYKAWSWFTLEEQGRTLLTSDIDAKGHPTTRRWRLSASEGDLGELLQ